MPRHEENPPPWVVSEWFNADGEVSLERLKGDVVVVCAFQLLCPGCVSHAIPQMKSAHEMFTPMGVSIIGLHTVFEHHEAMTPKTLKAFLHEYRIGFPVGVDAPGGDGEPIPRTMKLYRMRGTPTLLLYDRGGALRQQAFGHFPDLRLGAEIMALVNEPPGGEGAENPREPGGAATS